MALQVAMWLMFALVKPACAVILWTHPGPTQVHETGAGHDILNGALRRDDSANDTLYFKFHVNPLADVDTEEYWAGFVLFEGDEERLGIGNALKAWAYSAFLNITGATGTNNVPGYIDLRSANPEFPGIGAAGSYQYPRRGNGVTILFKIQFVPGEDDIVTVWLEPDLGPGANEAHQPDNLTTRFNANCSFDAIHLCHAGGGDGWEFSDLAIATSFSDFVDVTGARPPSPRAGMLGVLHAVSFESWQKEQGMPIGTIRALAQTADGFLWLGGDNGLARFDGLRFTTVKTPNGDDIRMVRTLLADRRGALWIGTHQHGLSLWFNNRFTTFTMLDGLPTNSITALAEDNTGRIWVGTETGLAILQNGQPLPLSPVAAFAGQRITALHGDRKGRIWIGVQGMGVFQFTDGKTTAVTGEDVAELLKNPHCLMVDRSGQLWVGAGSNSVLCLHQGEWRHYRIPRNMARGPISALAEETNATVWAGSTRGGLFQFKEGRPVAIPARDGLGEHSIEVLFTDRESILWVGTDTGLSRLRRKGIFTLGQSEGLGAGPGRALAEVAPGVVWAGKHDGLYRWDGRSFAWLHAAGLSPHNVPISAILVTRDGFCWVATTNGLLVYRNPVAAADEVTAIHSAPKNIISLAEDTEGAVWMGTSDGTIRQLRSGQLLTLTNVSTTNAITAIVPAPDGSVWIGTCGNGLYRVTSGAVTHVTPTHGLGSACIRTLYHDKQNTLWIGTADGGLGMYHNGRVATYTTRDGLPSDNISQILEDDIGRLWLGTGGGIVCISKTHLKEPGSRKITSIYAQWPGGSWGAASEECTWGFCPAGLKTSDGLLWFATSKGVVVVDPRAHLPTKFVPKPVLEEVLVDGAPMPTGFGSSPKYPATNLRPTGWMLHHEVLQIGPGRHQVEFRYTAPVMNTPELVQFRYKLEGLDINWVDAGTRRTAFYSYLPPGRYRFRVAAGNNDWGWTEAATVVELNVLHRFWQTWWFITIAALGVLVSVGTTIRVLERQRLRGRLKLMEKERALAHERTRIAQDLHDEIGAKLCRISFLSEHARADALPTRELRAAIESISNTSREVLRSLDEIVWAVNPQNDTLEHVASYIAQYAEEYFQMTGIQCEIELPAQLPPHSVSSRTRHNLFLAAHEALTNVLKHSQATRVRVSVTCTNAEFEVRIFDNGKGFNVPAVSPTSESHIHTLGNGLANMHRRLSEIGGNCRIASVPGQGTDIRLTIFLPHAQKELSFGL